uniref:Uncharacterized protein n=1 Tax=Rhizophora mucronata TaxID=61149 RepID=A0A2P2QYK1_RHIMU
MIEKEIVLRRLWFEEYSPKPSYPTSKARKGFVINPKLEVFRISNEGVLSFFTFCSIWWLPFIC